MKKIGEIVIVLIVGTATVVVLHALCDFFDASEYRTGYIVGWLGTVSIYTTMLIIEYVNEQDK